MMIKSRFYDRGYIRIILLTLTLGFAVLCFTNWLLFNHENFIVKSQIGSADQSFGPIDADTMLEQKFTCEKDRLESFTLRFGADTTGAKGITDVYLVDENDVLIEQFEVDNAYITAETQDYVFRLKYAQENVKSKTFTVRLVGSGSGTGLYCWYGNGGNNFWAAMNQTLLEGTLYMSVTHRVYDGNIVFRFAGIGIGLMILLAIFLYVADRKRLDFIWTYVILAMSLGLFMCTALPIGVAPDETRHFYRSYQIAEGNFIPEFNEQTQEGGGILPEGLDLFSDYNTLADTVNNFDRVPNAESDRWYEFSNTSTYTAVPYLASSLGIFMAQLFTDNILMMAYAGRVFNLLMFVIITGIAIKYLPFGKPLGAIACLSYMGLQEAASLSADGLTTASAFALFVFVLYLRYGTKKPMTRLQTVLLYILPIVVSLCKVIYVPVCLLLFLIPAECFRTKRKYWKHVCCIGVLIIICAVISLWNALSYPNKTGEGFGAMSQLEYILSHISLSVKTLIRGIISSLEVTVTGCIGSKLGPLGITINGIFIYGYLAVLAYFFAGDTIMPKECRNGLTRVILLGISACILILALLSQWLTWTPVGSSIIYGYQGRYFIPVLFTFLIGLCTFKRTVPETGNKEASGYAVPLMLYTFMAVCAVITVFVYSLC